MRAGKATASAGQTSSGNSNEDRCWRWCPQRALFGTPVGEVVEAGQGLLVLEAMKMENEIRAERAGVVRRFLVEPGQPVESGDPLFEVE